MNKSYDVYMCRTRPAVYTFRLPTLQEIILVDAENSRIRQETMKEMIRFNTELSVSLAESKRKADREMNLYLSVAFAAAVLLAVLPLFF